MNKFSEVIMRWLRSRQFFVFIVVLFVMEATWIAFSSRYPMAFDEDFHLGIIQIYAHHLSPFFLSQPAGANSFGAVARDPSYLYHYLMSFPWRLIVRLIHGTTAQIIALRLFNIAFVAAGLEMLRRAFAYTTVSPAVINTALFFLVITPLMPFVSAQINYDNLLFLLAAVTLLLTLKYLNVLNRYHRLDVKLLASVFVICFFTSLVKYSFLPIFVALIIYLALVTWLAYRPNPLSTIKNNVIKGWQALSLTTKIVLSILLILSFGLFLERDGYNTVKYATPAPECDQVIWASACKAYGPWQRNEVYLNTKQTRVVDIDPISFGHTWSGAYYYALFSTLNGPDSNYELGTALPIPYYTGEVIAVVGLIALVVAWRQLRQRYKYLGLLVWITTAYIVALWVQNYTDFVHLGEATALQGRYLLLVLPFIYLLIAVGISQCLKRFDTHWPIVKPTLFILILLCMLEGGGVLTYILRSNTNWYWRNNRTDVHINQTARRIITPLILDNKN